MTDLNELKTQLAAAAANPPRKPNPARDAVEQLKPEILAMKKAGWTYAQIAKKLTDGGVKISSSTLQNYLGAKTKKPRKKKDDDLPLGGMG